MGPDSKSFGILWGGLSLSFISAFIISSDDFWSWDGDDITAMISTSTSTDYYGFSNFGRGSFVGTTASCFEKENKLEKERFTLWTKPANRLPEELSEPVGQERSPFSWS